MSRTAVIPNIRQFDSTKMRRTITTLLGLIDASLVVAIGLVLLRAGSF